MKKPLTWIPWNIDSWIFGSSRHELTRPQRADFLDLCLLAGKDSGYIRANSEHGYPIMQLAGLLCVEAEELERTIEACVQVGKISRLANGVLYITNWERYKLTERHRRRLEKRASTPHPEEENEEKSKGEERKGKRTIGPQKGTSAPTPQEIEDSEDKKYGLLPIPKDLPFKDKDELVDRRAEIKRHCRMLAAGRFHDGPAQLTAETIEAEKRAFNARVKDFS